MPPVRSLSSLLIALVALVACGGTSGTPTANQGGDAGASTPDGGADAARASDGATQQTACPSSVPTQGAACATEGLECEYGGHQELTCETVASCSSAKWSVQSPTGTSCSGSDAGLDPACPTTSTSVAGGTTCSTSVRCAYADATCFCYQDHSGVPKAWGCFPAAGCPYPRPALGSACATNDQQCDYGPCGESVRCQKGSWTVGTGGCHP